MKSPARFSATMMLRGTLILLVLTARDVTAQNTEEKAPSDFLDDARKYVIQTASDGVRLELNEQSRLNWTNPIRQQERGATYVWTHRQRPYAIASLFTYVYNEKIYTKHEFHSLAPVPLKSTFDGKVAWAPSQAGVTWKEFAEPPAMAGTRVARLLQMRQLARQFRAELTSPKNERTELRLAPRPLVEYSSPETGVSDGVIFSFVVATDPEVLLLMETFDEPRKQGRTTGFRYAFARFHYWDVAAYLGDNEVWHASLDRTQESNNLGSRESLGKIYNSFHPYPGQSVPVSSDAGQSKKAVP